MPDRSPTGGNPNSGSFGGGFGPVGGHSPTPGRTAADFGGGPPRPGPRGPRDAPPSAGANPSLPPRSQDVLDLPRTNSGFGGIFGGAVASTDFPGWWLDADLGESVSAGAPGGAGGFADVTERAGRSAPDAGTERGRRQVDPLRELGIDRDGCIPVGGGIRFCVGAGRVASRATTRKLTKIVFDVGRDLLTRRLPARRPQQQKPDLARRVREFEELAELAERVRRAQAPKRPDLQLPPQPVFYPPTLPGADPRPDGKYGENIDLPVVLPQVVVSPAPARARPPGPAPGPLAVPGSAPVGVPRRSEFPIPSPAPVTAPGSSPGERFRRKTRTTGDPARAPARAPARSPSPMPSRNPLGLPSGFPQQLLNRIPFLLRGMTPSSAPRRGLTRGQQPGVGSSPALSPSPAATPSPSASASADPAAARGGRKECCACREPRKKKRKRKQCIRSVVRDSKTGRFAKR